MLQQVEPLPWEVIAQIRANKAFLSPLYAGMFTRQVVGSVLVGWQDEQGLVAAMGIFPVGSGGEVWLTGTPQRARKHLVGIARGARLTLAALHHHGVAPLMARVGSGHAPGRRLAHLVGFRNTPSDAPGVDLFLWDGRHGSGERDFLARATTEGG